MSKAFDIKLLVNAEVLFDFRSILCTIARYNNESQDVKKILNQDYFNTLKFNTIKEFVESYFNNDIKLEENSKLLKENLKNNKIFNSLKPKLITASEVLFLTDFLKSDNSNVELILFSYEEYYINILNNLDILSKMEKIYKSLNLISIKGSNLFECELKSKNTNLYVMIDTEQNKSFNNNLSFGHDVLYFYKPSICKQNQESKFNELIKKLSNLLSKNYDSSMEIYNNFISSQFVYKYTSDLLNRNFEFLSLWRNMINIKENIILEGKIVPGFKRGSKLLGVPTANMEINENILIKLKSITTGVYYGSLRFKINDDKVYKGVLSIGYNPYFNNDQKTIEVFLIDYEGEDFYDEVVELKITGFVRPEASFENFSELVTAITYDIITSNEILNKL
jgi:hypothetical protein